MLGLLQYRTWAISEVYFNQMAPLVLKALVHGHNLVKKKTISDFMPRIEALAYTIDPATDKIRIEVDWQGNELIPTVKVGSKTIALIPVIGPITKYGDACSYGAQDYQRWINMSNADPDIHGIVLIMDTPGGTVDGTPELGMAVKNSPKPVGVFGDGVVASAGMWIASQASVIVGNKNNPTEFGSIGVFMIMEDYSNVIEAGRIQKLEIIRAPQSTEKALVNPIEPLSEDMRARVLSDLKSTAEDFISTVKSGRGEKLNINMEGLFKGRMFDTAESKAGGLIDAVGTLSTAINKVAELARVQQRSAGNTISVDGGILVLNKNVDKQ